MNKYESVALMQANSDIFKNGIPENMTDLGNFTMLCPISLMPLFIFQKIGDKKGKTYYTRA